MRILATILVSLTLAPAVAGAAAPPQHRALIRHMPPAEAVAGSDLRLVAVIDDAWSEGGLVVRYRPAAAAGEDFASAPFRRSSAGGYHAVIPAAAVRRPGVLYYIEGARGEVTHFASRSHPYLVRVERAPGSAWKEAELRRLGGRRHSLAVETRVQDFGTSHGVDRYYGGELDWKYRLVERLYAIHLGFGFLEGLTPVSLMPGTDSERRGYRYGYGGVRLRLRDAVWLDGRVILGFSDEGFSPGAGAQLVLGDDWRTCVKLGAEGSEALSYRAWITLQWDTVPGVLMSATAATTDEPRAAIDAGSYVMYRVELPVTGALSLSGEVSFGARGNRPGGFGGGLASEMSF